jgi:hypothetical protein
MVEVVMHLGTVRFGPPPQTVRAALSEISDADRLAALAERVPAAASWDELLPSP